MKKEGKIGAHSAVTSAGRCASLLPIDVHPCRQLVTAPLIGLTPAARRPTGAGVDEESWDRRTKGTVGYLEWPDQWQKTANLTALHLQPRTNSMWHPATLISTSMLGLGLVPGRS